MSDPSSQVEVFEPQLYDRRDAAKILALAAAGLWLGGCGPDGQPTPTPTDTETATPPPPTPESKILDLTPIAANTPPPAAVVAAALGIARLWVDNTKLGLRNQVSAVHINEPGQPGLFLTAAHIRRDQNGNLVLPRFRARLAVKTSNGLQVVEADDAGFIEDPLTDSAVLIERDMPSGTTALSMTEREVFPLGTPVHVFGYESNNRFAVPIGQPVTQAGFRAALLSRQPGQDFQILAGVGASETSSGFNRSGEGQTGGGVLLDDGSVLGFDLAREGEIMNVGQLLERGFDIEQVVLNGQELPKSQMVQVVTCQRISRSLLDRLLATVQPIPAP